MAGMTARAADGLDGFLDRGRDRIADAEVAGFDETGLRVAGKLALGALRPHRQVHPDHLPPQARPQRHRRRRRPAAVPRGRGARRLGALRHLPRRRTSAVLCPRVARAGRRRRHRAGRCRLVLGHPGRRRARRVQPVIGDAVVSTPSADRVGGFPIRTAPCTSSERPSDAVTTDEVGVALQHRRPAPVRPGIDRARELAGGIGRAPFQQRRGAYRHHASSIRVGCADRWPAIRSPTPSTTYSSPSSDPSPSASRHATNAAAPSVGRRCTTRAAAGVPRPARRAGTFCDKTGGGGGRKCALGRLISAW